MRVAAAAVVALAGLVAPAVGSAPPKPITPISPITIHPTGTATASAVPAMAGARPVELTLTLRLELKCGRPMSGPIIVVLPAAARVPASIPRAAVRLNGRPPSGMSVSHHVVGLALPRTTGLSCDVIAPGTLTVVFMRAAGVGNPAAPGTYPVSLRAGGTTAIAKLIVS